jgi:IS5 family transposase
LKSPHGLRLFFAYPRSSTSSPIQLLITPGQAHDLTGAEPLLGDLSRGTIIVADKAYDADRLRGHIKACGATANNPNMIPAQ